VDETKIFLIVIGVAVVIVIGYFAFQSDQTESITKEQIAEIEKQIEETAGDFSPTALGWLTSGPFQIDKSQYLLGENIFVRISNHTHTPHILHTHLHTSHTHTIHI